MNAFHRATRASVPLKIGITGASGSGKTTAALRVTRGLVGPDARIAFCDTENGSASLYCDITPFDVLNMEPPYHTEKFIAAIDAAVAGGYKALVIDSVAHAWLQVLQDKEALDARGGNNWTNWAGFTKKWEALLAHIRNAPIHLVMCIRSKEKHEMNEAKKVVKMGVGAQIREGFSFEVTTLFDLDMSHGAKAEKDRTRLFEGVIEPLTENTGRKLAEWLNGGGVLAPEPAPAFTERAPQISEKETQAQLGQMVQDKKEENLHKPVDASSASFADSITPLPRITMSQWEDLNDLQTAAQIDGRQLRPYCVKKGWLPANAEGLDRLSPEGFKPLQLNMGAEKSRAFKAWLETNFPLPITPRKTKRSKSAA